MGTGLDCATDGGGGSVGWGGHGNEVEVMGMFEVKVSE